MRVALVVAASGCVNIPSFHGGAAGDAAPSDDSGPLPINTCGAVIVSGLKAYLPFNETTGTSAADVSANHHDGTVHGTWNTGRLGNAVSLNGTDDFVQFGAVAPFDMMPAVSVCAWVYPNIVTAGSATLVDKSVDGDTGGWNMYLQRVGAGQVIGFFTRYQAYLQATVAIPELQWTHVCTTWNGQPAISGITLYRNGALEAGGGLHADGRAGFDPDSGIPLTLGRVANANRYYLNGRLDDVAIYDHVLTASEVLAIYDCGNP